MYCEVHLLHYLGNHFLNSIFQSLGSKSGCSNVLFNLHVVLPTHMPLLMKILEPVWAEWELFGAALNIPFTKLQNIKSNNQVTLCHGDKLLKLQHVIYEFGKMTGSEKYTWKKIHKAVTDLGRKDIANKIKEDHKSLDEPCKLAHIH